VLLCVHGSETPAVLTLPDAGWARAWRIAADSAAPDRGGAAGATLALHPRSVVLLHATDAPARPGSAPDATLLAQLARSAGIQTHWHDLDGRAHAVPRTTIEALLRAMAVPAATAAQARESHAELSLAPRAAGSVAACFLPEGLAAGERRFGIAAQTYALRRTNDQGVGDYTALARLAVRARDAGATWLGVSPPHALMPADRMRASPYQPSDRRFLEPVLLDVSALGELQGRAEVRAALARAEPIFAALRAGGLVDYPAVWQAKDRVLRAAWAALPGAPALHEAFRAFRAQGGPILDLFAAHGAIADQLCHTRVDAPGSPMVRSWMAEHAEELGYRAFLQFLCDRQLAQSAAQGVGLYRDLAVGCAPDGAEAWSQPDRFLRGFSVGAPPDRFAPAGQVWGLPPPDPRTAAPMLAELLRANMRHAAALRIDHVMGLRRLFVVPDGATGAEGCYLAYPFEALLTEVARASMAARCAVVGEDLGTVPDGLRAALHEARVLSYRVLWFERDGNDFVPPASWPAQATACVSTHDLPTLAGWWQGTDITERAALGLADAETGLPHRAAERAALCRAMGCAEDAAFSPDIAAAVHAHVAAAPCAMMLVQAEDLAGETVAVNLPGTDRERPNWRRRLALDVDALAEGPTARAILAALAARRR
jgi:glycogen operon protein